MDGSTRKSLLFSWQKNDKSILESHIISDRSIVIKSVNFDYDRLFIYDIIDDETSIISIDKNEFNLPLFPFYESLNTFYKSEGSHLSTRELLGNVMLDLTGLETLRYLINNLRDRDLMLDENAQGIINSLVKLIAMKGHINIVCKSPHLFDEESKQLLKLLLELRLVNDYPSLKNIFFILLTDDYSDPIYRFAETHYELKEPTEHNIQEIFSVLGGANIQDELKYAIFQISECNLNKIKYFIDNTTLINSDLILDNIGKTVDSIIAEKLKTIGDSSRDLVRILSTASEIGDVIDLLPLVKAISEEQAFVEDILELSQKHHFTVINQQTIRFANIYVRQYFHRLHKYRYTINKKIADAYAVLYPSNYEVRLFFLEKSSSELLNDACDLLILIWLDYIKSELKIPQDLKIRLDNYLKYFPRKEYVKTMESFFQAFNNQQFERALDILNMYSEVDSPLLMLERDYYKGLAYYNCSRGKEDLKNALTYMHDVRCRSKNISTALYEKSSLTLISFLINISGDMDTALRIERDVMYSISARIQYDINAKDQLHRIYRKYEALHPIELAVHKTEASISYFEKTSMTHEYYMALINHIGNLLHLGRYADAYSYASIIYTNINIFYSKKNSKIIVYSLNNIILSSYQKGIQISKCLLTQYMDILNSTPTNPTNIIPYLTMSIIFYEQWQDIELSKKLLDKSKQLNCLINDPYYEYYILNNEASFLYLESKREDAIAISHKIYNAMPILCREKMRKTLQVRADIILSNMEKGNSKNVIDEELQKWNCDYPLLKNYFLLSDIQFWSE